MKPLRQVAIILLCTALAIGSSAQALSNIQARKSPQLATLASPLASEALEILARNSLEVTENGEVKPSQQSLSLAKEAYQASPLATEALAILAVGQETETERSEAIEAALRLSRRGRVLGAVSLQNSLEIEHTEGVIRAMNRLVTQYPSLAHSMVTPMIGYVKDEEALLTFREILAAQPEWRDAFFSANARDEATLRNLARLRVAMGADYPLREGTDQQLSNRLVQQQLWPEALRLHSLDKRIEEIVLGQPISWNSERPPFHWQLSDEFKFRARAGKNSREVAIRIDPGQGGRLASRILPIPPGAQALTIVSKGMDGPEGALEWSASCVEGTDKFARAEISKRRSSLRVGDAPCKWISVEITGRVFSTDPAFRAILGPAIFR